MPNLGDFLGHLMSEITIARMHADIEAIRIAELYASNPLLANLPVPHFRLPNIDIDVPVVIQNLEEDSNGPSSRGTPKIKEMQDKFNELLAKFIKDESIELKQIEKKKLEKSIEKNIFEISRNEGFTSNIFHVADTLADIVSVAFTEPNGPMDKLKREKLKESLKKISRDEFLKLSKPPTRLKTLINTSEIKEAGPNDIITRLHLKISEEAFEWTTIELDGERKDRLVPE